MYGLVRPPHTLKNKSNNFIMEYDMSDDRNAYEFMLNPRLR